MAEDSDWTLRPLSPVVLLVEDHEDTREMYEAVLTGAGFEVLHAASGVEALTVTTNASPAIVLTDIRMGGPVSALDVCRHFHALGVPVLAVTGHGPGAEHEAMLRAGCSGVLMKPIAPDCLVAEVRRVLAGHR